MKSPDADLFQGDEFCPQSRQLEGRILPFQGWEHSKGREEASCAWGFSGYTFDLEFEGGGAEREWVTEQGRSHWSDSEVWHEGSAGVLHGKETLPAVAGNIFAVLCVWQSLGLCYFSVYL